MALSTLIQGGPVNFGTLYLNGVKQARPANPISGGCPDYSGGNIEIRDTDGVDAYNLKWIPVSISGKWLLVCDRNIVQNVSWNTLNAQGLVSGKTVVIDGVPVKIRLLSGGVKDRVSDLDGHAGGTPLDNEWDRIIQNEGGYSGLPTPVAADKTNGPNSSGTHNQVWHWADMDSWVKESHEIITDKRVVRGCWAASYLKAYAPSDMYMSLGFRPALEILNLAPLVSDLGGSLGNKSASFSIPYTVNDPDGDTFTLLEQVDGTTIRNLANQSSGGFTLNLSSVWNGLGLGSHTLTVTATDPGGTSGTSTAAFIKAAANNAPNAPAYPLANGSRIPVSGYFEFIPGTDPEGDAQTVTLQHAANAGFTSATSVTSGLQKWDGSAWVNVTNVPAAAAGVRHRLPYSGLTLNSTRYFRVNASDGANTANGAALTLKIGTTLQVQTPVYEAAAMPVKVKTALEATLSAGSGVGQVLVCNNGKDPSPTWEDATASYLSGAAAYPFANAGKTASGWGVAVKALINAGTATGEISLTKISLGVL